MDETANSAPRRPKAPRVLLGLVALILVGGGAFALLRRGQQSTDDAQVEGRIINVAARVPGQVQRLLVRDNQLVQAGEVLVELDPADSEARLQVARAEAAAARASAEAARVQLQLTEKNSAANLQQARGGVTQAQSGLFASQATISQAEADQRAAESRYRQARLDLDRARLLRERGAAAVAELDQRQSAFDQAEASLRQAEARLATARATSSGSSAAIQSARGRLEAAATVPEQVALARAQLQLAEARVQQAEAAERLAALSRSYTTIKAPVRGVVSRRSVEVGALVAPERPLIALVPPDDTWIVANFKEDQLADMRPGQRAEVALDAYGGRRFAAAVDSLSYATGARFALIPPDNASGNFVKVAQRVPVLIRMAGDVGVALRPGLSATVTVFTRGR